MQAKPLSIPNPRNRCLDTTLHRTATIVCSANRAYKYPSPASNQPKSKHPTRSPSNNPQPLIPSNKHNLYKIPSPFPHLPPKSPNSNPFTQTKNEHPSFSRSLRGGRPHLPARRMPRRDRIARRPRTVCSQASRISDASSGACR